MYSTDIRHAATWLLSATLVVVLLGCNKAPQAEVAKAPSQVAVKVNSDEISVHQLNAALGQLGAKSEEQAKQAAPQVLERLIDQQLLIQKALENKLDRDPRIMQAIDNSRRQILAQAYMERTTGAAPKPPAAEIEAFYKQHPELFEQRRIYRFNEIAVNSKPEQLDGIKGRLAKGDSINQLADYLRNEKIPFNVNTSVKPADQLPLEWVARVHTMKDGQIAVIPGANGGVNLLHLAASQASPWDTKQATPFIEQFMVNRKKFELAQNEVKQLRQSAKLEYVGEFEKTKPQPVAASPAPAVAPAAAGAAQSPAASASPVPAASSPAPASPAAAASDLDKTLSGAK